MGYRAEVVEYSVSERGMPLLSVEIEYPRCVLAEVVTHRKLFDTSACDSNYVEMDFAERQATRDISKNSASSRAIPFAKMLKKVLEDPYIPDAFSVAGPGMQAAGYMEGMEQVEAADRWLGARDEAVCCALDMLSDEDRLKVKEAIPLVRRWNHRAKGLPRSVHKQDINRLLEPWAWMTQIVTADGQGWANFFALRCHKDAAPAFQKAARMIYLAKRKATPRLLKAGEWHLPYVKPTEKDGFVWHPQPGGDSFPDPVVMSVARCAWVSYMNQGKEATMEDARRTFDRLFAGDVKHASPGEHQGTPMTELQEATWKWAKSNLSGWLQARKLISGEAIRSVEFSDEEIASWNLKEYE